MGSAIIVSETNKPPLHIYASWVFDFERGFDPWPAAAFPDELKHAGTTGARAEGWHCLDWCGNVVGFIADGTEINLKKKGSKMKKYIKYLSYIIRHKWFVFIAGVDLKKTGRKISLWRLMVHDLSKFCPNEWVPYMEHFYGDNLSEKEIADVPGDYRHFFVSKERWAKKFDVAWLHHIHRNPHHWQYWVLREDDGGTITIEMPEKYMHEMVADWLGAGRAITGRWETEEWYQKNKSNMMLHDKTRKSVEAIILVGSKQ